MANAEQQQANHKLLVKLSLIIVGMFVFAIGILPPMYDAICDLTGLNGKTSNTAASSEGLIADTDRLVTVMFLADTDPAMPWRFYPLERTVKVHPGEINRMDFRVQNPTDSWQVGQAIPSVAPSQASAYFKKTECFCFREQPLEAKAERDMPLIFYIDPELPKSVTTITLSYQLFNITNEAKQRQNQLASK